MKNSINLTITLLKRSGNETRLFVAITALISAMIFNFVNLMLSPQGKVTSPTDIYSISSMLCFILVVAFFVLYHANNYLNKVKSSEIGLECLCGASTYQIGFLLTVHITILNFIGYFFGIIIGIILSPIFFNFLFGEFLFKISLEALLYIFIFLIFQSITLGMINQGFGYRNDIKDLLGLNAQSNFFAEKFKKKLKFTNYFCILLILSCLLIFAIPEDQILSFRDAILLTVIFPLIGSIMFFKTWLPLYIDKIKSKKYLNHKYKLIILSNLKTSLGKNATIFKILILIGATFPMLATMFDVESKVDLFNTLSFVITILFMSFLMTFYGLSTSLDEIKTLSSLIVLGYSREDLIKITKDKIIILYAILLVFPLFITSVYIIFSVIFLNFSMSLALIFIGSYLVVFFISTFITYSISLKMLKSSTEHIRGI